MADLHLRLGRDVLTIADSAKNYLMSQGFDPKKDGAPALFVEPEIFEEALRLDASSGAQCVVLNTFSFAPLDLRTSNSLEKAVQLAQKTCSLAKNFKIQHPFIKVEPCGLPLDEQNKTSLNEHCEQYKFIAHLFDDSLIDGFLVSGFENLTELKCALIGLRKATDKTIVFDVSQIEGQFPLVEDFAPASVIKETIDAHKSEHIDAILERAEKIAQSGQQFLYIEGAKASTISAIAAVTSGLYL